MNASLSLLPPQFADGGPEIVVKNTFIDIADALRPDDLTRAKTAPPDFGPALEGEDDEPVFAAPLRRSSCSSSSSGRDADERMEAEPEQSYDHEGRPGSFHSPAPRKMSDEYVEELGDEALGGWVGSADSPSPGAGKEQHMDRISPFAGLSPSPGAGFVGSEWLGSDGSPSPDAGKEQHMDQISVKSPETESINFKASYSHGDPKTPQYLTRRYEESDGGYRVMWRVDARKLVGNDKQIVSPAIPIYFSPEHPEVTFKLMLYPKMPEGLVIDNESKGGQIKGENKGEQGKVEKQNKGGSQAKGSSCFKNSKGWGLIQLKCESDLLKAGSFVHMRLAISRPDGELGQWRPEGRPQHHDFAHSTICGLPKDKGFDLWNFLEVVDESKETFDVHLCIGCQ
jgi:hypothetical protein